MKGVFTVFIQYALVQVGCMKRPYGLDLTHEPFKIKYWVTGMRNENGSCSANLQRNKYFFNRFRKQSKHICSFYFEIIIIIYFLLTNKINSALSPITNSDIGAFKYLQANDLLAPACGCELLSFGDRPQCVK